MVPVGPDNDAPARASEMVVQPCQKGAKCQGIGPYSHARFSCDKLLVTDTALHELLHFPHQVLCTAVTPARLLTPEADEITVPTVQLGNVESGVFGPSSKMCLCQDGNVRY